MKLNWFPVKTSEKSMGRPSRSGPKARDRIVDQRSKRVIFPRADAPRADCQAKRLGLVRVRVIDDELARRSVIQHRANLLVEKVAVNVIALEQRHALGQRITLGLELA